MYYDIEKPHCISVAFVCLKKKQYLCNVFDIKNVRV